MLSTGLCLMETGKKTISLRVRSDIAQFLNAAFPPPLHLHGLDPGLLAQKQRNPPHCVPLRKGETFVYNLGKLGNPGCQETQIRPVFKRMFFWDLRTYKSVCLILLSNSSSFQVRKGAGVYWWVRYVAKLMCKWNSCVHWQGSIDGSIRQLLKSTSHVQLEEVALARHGPLNQQTVTLSKNSTINDPC